MKFTLLIALLFSGALLAQVVNTATIDTTGGEKVGKITIGGYVDAYYGFANTRGDVPFFVSSNQTENININLAYVDLRYHTERVRARIVPGFGTYMNNNYQNEQGGLQHLVEANAGVKLFKTKQIWLDVGVLGSPYTNESAVSKDHAMYTRSLAPEYVPYYLSGAKISMPLSSKVNMSIYLINGWQQIQDVNTQKSLGTQLEWRPNSKNLINWNTYIGSEQSASNPLFRTRYFSDVYWIFDNGKRFSMSSCIYYGIQETKNNQISPYWWQANAIVSYKIKPNFSLAFRAEYFQDRDQVMAYTYNGDPFEVMGLGLCANLKVSDHALLRLDGRSLQAKHNIFNQDTRQLFWITSSLTVWF
jgi:hypothetical protein